MSDWLAPLILGIVEGLTEFIPVSSTGHLILLVDGFKLALPPGKVFEVVIQLGAILAICWHYRHRLLTAAKGAPHRRAEQYFILSLLVAFLPAAVLGVLFHGTIKAHLFQPSVVAAMLIVGGIAILLIERYKPSPRHHNPQQFGVVLAMKIGFCQALAMIPGTSRSGATIMGAMLLGVERKAAMEFSFFLAIPTMLAATVYDLYKNWNYLDNEGWMQIAIGFLVAFLSALWLVRRVLDFVGRHGFVPFAYYRIALGLIMFLVIGV